jgi:hypothetical protein
MIKITQLTRTSFACPSQWSGLTDDGRHLYIRYRHGNFMVEVNREIIYQDCPNLSSDGCMSFEELKSLTANFLTFDCIEDTKEEI